VLRFASTHLDSWLAARDRKPLVLRGARQVGKTWLVRELAQRSSRQLVELNLERDPDYAEHFRDNDPQRVLRNLEANLNVSLRPESSLLFLDEIQAAPQLLASLRWFREDLPELPVIAAGSLLEFALRDHQFSMPVGRISYCHLEPMSFYEFLEAGDNGKLREVLSDPDQCLRLPFPLHRKALDLLAVYYLVGGLPEVVECWVREQDRSAVAARHRDLLATYRDDFNKYRDRASPELLRRVLESVPRQLGTKFVYTQVDTDSRHAELKRALEGLVLARLCHRVEHTAGNGVPLGAETNEKFFKAILADVGLAGALLALPAVQQRDAESLVWVNRGGMAEQVVGQLLLAARPVYEEPRLFCWQRTGGRQGEIDYLFAHGPTVVPLEVKAGSAGSMKSLHAFMHAKALPVAVRCDTNLPSVADLQVKTTTGDDVTYRLLSLPIYMVESLPKLLDTAGAK
jgi:predicted AAA+ superfamily ATPase